jgi:hypothetical protein
LQQRFTINGYLNFKTMTKQELWAQAYIETLKGGASTINAESAATKAVEAFERRFPDYKIPKGARDVRFTPLPPPDREIREGEEPTKPRKGWL